MSSRITTLVALCLALVGCGSDPGLVATGLYRVEGVGINTGIQLTEETRIDAGGAVTGSCIISDSLERRTVSIDLFTNGSALENQLRHGTIAARNGSSSATLTAEVGARTYSASNCAVTVEMLDQRGNAVIGTDGACRLTAGDGSTLDATVDLSVFGCTVVAE